MLYYFYFTECDVCPLPKTRCLQIGSICYLIFCHIVNDWFHAKKLCQSEGADLAILESNRLNQIADFLYNLPNTCSYYWIGISTFSWIAKNGKSFTQQPYNENVQKTS